MVYRDLAADPISHLNRLLLVAVGIDPSQFASEISRELAISANAMADWRDTPIPIDGSLLTGMAGNDTLRS
jgi:hypothetical protein